MEVYDIDRNNSEVIDVQLNKQFSPETFECLTLSDQSLIVQYSPEEEKKVEESNEEDLVLTFGTT